MGEGEERRRGRGVGKEGEEEGEGRQSTTKCMVFKRADNEAAALDAVILFQTIGH